MRNSCKGGELDKYVRNNKGRSIETWNKRSVQNGTFVKHWKGDFGAKAIRISADFGTDFLIELQWVTEFQIYSW